MRIKEETGAKTSFRMICLVLFTLPLFCFIFSGRASGLEDAVHKDAFEREIQEKMGVTWNEKALEEGTDLDLVKELLDLGLIILINDEVEGLPWLVSVGGLVEAPAEAIFSVMTDFEHYPEFMPQTERVELERRTDNISVVTYHLKVNAGFIPIRATYSNYQYLRPPDRIDWALESGEFESLHGFWELIPVDGGKRTIIIYTVHSRPRQSVLKWLFKEEPALELMINVSSGAMIVKAIKERSEAVHGGGKPASEEEPVSKRTINEILVKDGPRLASLARRGKMVLLEEKEYVYSTAMIIIDRPGQEVWEGLLRVEDFAESTRNFDSEIIKREESSMTVKHRLIINFIVAGIDFEYILKYTLTAPELMTWETVGGELEDYTGFWRVIPVDEGSKTLLVYHGGSDMESLGRLMSYLLNMEPTFKHAIESSYSLSRVSGFKDWAVKQDEKQVE